MKPKLFSKNYLMPFFNLNKGYILKIRVNILENRLSG